MNPNELLEQFILESREGLETIGQRLLQVEQDPHDRSLLDDLFRQVHTLKGNSGLFEFKALERLVHAGEDLLEQVRSGIIGYGAEIADALLEAMDYTAVLIDAIEAGGRLPVDADARAARLAEALRRHVQVDPALAVAASVAAAGVDASATLPSGVRPLRSAVVEPEWLAGLLASPVEIARPDVNVQSSAAVHPDGAPATAQGAAPTVADMLAGGSTALRYRPEAECFFKGEDPWFLVRSVPLLQHLVVGAAQPWPAAAAFDCYRCNLEFVLVCAATTAQLAEHFRYVPEQIELWCPPPVNVGVTIDTPAGAVAAVQPSSLRDRIGNLWQSQCVVLAEPDVVEGTVVAARLTLERLLRVWGDAEAEAVAQAALAAIAPGAQALAQWARDHAPGQDQAADGTAHHGAHDGAHEAAQGGADAAAHGAAHGAVHTPAGAAYGANVQTDQQPPRRSTNAVDSVNTERVNRVVKVGQDKIDRLMELVGEMVVAKNALPYLAERAEQVFKQRELAREIKAHVAVINRVAEDLQHAMMAVRMLPVGTIFQRFSRLVRDTSRRLDKEVRLVIEGEDTAADKTVIEALADPLIHLVRNSLDHGIESPADRRAAGKPPVGTIHISARQEGDRIHLLIRDDGAGIDPQRVRAKAVQRGLITAERALQIDDAQAVQLIFMAGLSTRETISDLSGRGVGMDVVRSAVERINGTVSLRSETGKGTEIALAVPLSMAVSHVMMIEAAGRRFGVPMDAIVETVRVAQSDIHHFKQVQTTVLRGRVVPLRALHALLALPAGPILNEHQEVAVMVLRANGDPVGIVVDSFLGTSDILLKPLEGVLAGITAFAGTALLGDGSVLMVLDPRELI